MSTNGTSAIDNFAASANAFLSTVNGNGTGSLSNLFESLLSASGSQTQSGSGNGNQDTSTRNSASASSSTLHDVLNDVISSLRAFSAKWAKYESSHSTSTKAQGSTSTDTTSAKPGKDDTGTHHTADSSTTTTGAAAGAPPASTASTSTPPAGSNNTGSPADTSSATAGSGDQDPNNDPTLSDLAAALQAAMQKVQAMLDNAKTSGGTSSDTSASDSSAATASQSATDPSTSDLLAAGSALTDLLALAQSIEKKSASSGTGTGTDPSTGDSQTSTNLASLDTQLKANLKSLVDEFTSAVARQSQTNANNPTTNTNGVTSTSPDITLTAAATDTAALSAGSSIIKNSLAAANDFLNQVSSLCTPPASAALGSGSLLTLNAISATTGAGDADNDDNHSSLGAATTQPNLNLAAAGDAKASSPYGFASQLSATRAQNGGTTGLPSVIEQVSLQLNRNAKSGTDQMSLQLHPADLGTINVKLTFAADGSVSGTVTASNADTLAMLQKDSRSLERALQDAGLRADPGSLQFNLGNQQNPNQASQDTFAGGGSSGTGKSDSMTGDGGASTADDTATITESWVISPGRVNIRV